MRAVNSTQHATYSRPDISISKLSSDDPVRVFQRSATLDAVPNGRAEVILGRGSFTESFPLFGYPLDQYEGMFEKRLALFAALRDARTEATPVTWRGILRASLSDQRAFPTAVTPLRTWIGVGGRPESLCALRGTKCH